MVVSLGVVAAGLVLGERTYRTGEVMLTGVILRVISSDGVYVSTARQAVYFGLGSDQPFGLRMAPECTSAFLLLPLIAIGIGMIALRPLVAHQVLFSLLIACSALIAVNQVRLVGLFGLIEVFGTKSGYYWGHTMLGSVISVLGGAAALVLFVWLATRRPSAVRSAAAA